MLQNLVDQKIKDCKVLVVQNQEKTIQSKMFFMFLRDRKIDGEVKQLSINNKDGLVKIQFFEHQKAMSFYNDRNFKERLLMRPFNIYLDLKLAEDQMKKYYLEGVTEQNQRAIFDAARKIGICKLYNKYLGGQNRGTLKPNCVLSFIRKDQISEEEIQPFEEKLKAINVKLFNYVPDKEFKVCLNLINFLEDEHFSKDETALREIAEKRALQVLHRHLGNVEFENVTINFKKREGEKSPKLLTRAIFEFTTVEQAYTHYEKLRVALLNEGIIEAKLYFHNQEYNSYHCLASLRVINPEKKDIKQFEEQLVKAFRIIHPSLLQVSASINNSTKNYFVKSYFPTEDIGKQFVADWGNYRQSVYQYFVDKLINFDLNVDSDVIKKITQGKQKVREIEGRLKKTNERDRRNTQRSHNVMPLPFNPIVGMNNGNFVMPPQMPQMMGMVSQVPNKVPMAAPNSMNFMVPPPPYAHQKMPTAPSSLSKLKQMLLNKQKMLDMQENSAKRSMNPLLKQLIEEQNIARGQEATSIANIFMKDKNVGHIIKLLENYEQFKEAAIAIKNSRI